MPLNECKSVKTMSEKHIKECGLCKNSFTAHDLIFDPNLQPIGMSYDYKSNVAYYFFQHNSPNCGTSFIIDTRLFIDFIDEEISPKSMFRTKPCKNHCVHLDDLETCENECFHAPFRRFLLYMIKQKKKSRDALEITKNY
jgi:hypothetical protein